MCWRNGLMQISNLVMVFLIALTGLIPLVSFGQDEEIGIAIREPKETNLTGHWDLNFNNSTLKLSLCQIEGDSFGYGNLTQDNTTKEIAAAGSVAENHVALYLIAVKGDMMWKMDLTVNGVIVTGSYISHSYDGTVMNGTVSGGVLVGEYIPMEKFGHSPGKSKS